MWIYLDYLQADKPVEWRRYALRPGRSVYVSNVVTTKFLRIQAHLASHSQFDQPFFRSSWKSIVFLCAPFLSPVFLCWRLFAMFFVWSYFFVEVVVVVHPPVVFARSVFARLSTATSTAFLWTPNIVLGSSALFFRKRKVPCDHWDRATVGVTISFVVEIGLNTP